MSNPYAIPNPRVLTIDEARSKSCVLTDATSLSNLDHLADPDFATRMRQHHVSDTGFAIQYHFLQAFILYEHIIVDSILIDSHSHVREAFDTCEDVLRGVYLPFNTRSLIGNRLQHYVHCDLELEHHCGMTTPEFQNLRFNDGLEQHEEEVETRHVPPASINDQWISYFSNGFPADLPSVLSRSSSSVGRAHFYLELARELQVPLAPEPHKALYFGRLMQKFKSATIKGVADAVVETFDRKVRENISKVSDGIISSEIGIPAIPEYIIRFAQKYKISLLAAAQEIRISKNARNFRGWCQELASAMLSGRATTGAQQKMFEELERVSSAWTADISEGVEYKRRKLNLEKIPIIGELLKGGGMGEWGVRDPILKPSREVSYFLFLNDLLRPPRRSPPKR
jgi:hypothetical protein